MSIRSGVQPATPQSTGHRETESGGGFGRHDTRASATFTGADLAAVVARAELLLARNRVLLDRLDAELGDGDHGENMTAGFAEAVRSVVPADTPDDVGDLLRRLGHQLVSSVGGAGGSLYGTAFIEAGIAVAGLPALSPEDTARALDAAAEGLARRGRCRLGDKTIYDALRPGADAFAAAIASGEGRDVAIRAAIRAARDGMEATTPLVARRGLALRLGERSRGHQDPGATSCYLLFRALLASGSRA
jgi:dihydroxyacetone kinase-like protein